MILIVYVNAYQKDVYDKASCSLNVSFNNHSAEGDVGEKEVGCLKTTLKMIVLEYNK